MGLPEVKQLLSSEHFSVDGTLIQAWARLKSFRRKEGGDEPPGPGRNGEQDFKGEKRSNATHASTTDPDARLYRKGNGQPAELCTATADGGWDSDAATGDAEPLAAIELVRGLAGKRRITLGTDKDDTANFVLEYREENVTPARGPEHHETAARASTLAPPGTPATRSPSPIRKRIEEGLGEGDREARPGQAARLTPPDLQLKHWMRNAPPAPRTPCAMP